MWLIHKSVIHNPVCFGQTADSYKGEQLDYCHTTSTGANHLLYTLVLSIEVDVATKLTQSRYACFLFSSQQGLLHWLQKVKLYVSFWEYDPTSHSIY